MIPENPTSENIRPVLESLPVSHSLLVRAGVVNKNGRLYTKECLEGAMANLQSRISKGQLLVHDQVKRDAVGVVTDAHFDGDQINIHVHYTRRSWGMVAKVMPMSFSFDANCAGSGNEIYEMYVNSILVVPSSMEHLF